MHHRNHLIAATSFSFLLAFAGIPIAQDSRPTATGAAETADASAEAGGELTGTAQIAAGRGASLVFDEKSFDFGTIWKGDPIAYTFTVRNIGDEPYEIIKVKPACGCTLAGKHATLLEPGESGEIPLELKTTGLRGPFKKRITVTTSDPSVQFTTLELSGTAKELFAINPPSAYFGNLRPGQTAERIVTIENQTDGPVTLTLKEGSIKEPFTAEFSEKEAGKIYELKIGITGGSAGEYLSSVAVLEAAEEGVAPIRMNVAARVLPELEVRPPSVVISRTFGRTLKRRLSVRNHTETPVKLLEAKSNDAKISVVIQELAEGETFLVNIEIAPGWETTADDSKVTLVFDDGKTVDVPITLRERPVTKPAQAATPAAKSPE